MNIITKNMNKINTNIVITIVTSIKIMNVQKRGGTKIIPNHALDTIGNPSEACLPSSRPNLTSYVLELMKL